MSHENVEIVRRAIDAFNRRDLDAAFRDADPDQEVDWSRSRGVEAGIYRGYEATREFWSKLLDTFDGIVVAAEAFIESGDQVVVPNRTRFIGRDGVAVTARSALVVTLRGERIICWTLYQERAEALEAVGLRE